MGPDHAVRIVTDDRSDPIVIEMTGDLTIHTVTPISQKFDSVASDAQVRVDLGAVSRLDTAGAWALAVLQARLEGGGGRLAIDGATPEMRTVLDSVAQSLPEPQTEPVAPTTLAGLLETVGRRVADGGRFLLGLAAYLGMFLSRLVRGVTHPREFRLTSLVHHCEEVGVKAVPIVALMAFLIGVVLAFQGASQLRQFGAEVFVVDLIAVSILRELGILLTAIIVAGRTASAFTASIGSMKMREEIDAMRTLGLDPAMILFVPRILALLLMLPILGLIANLAGLFGGALMSWIELGISPGMFLTRLVEGTDTDHLMVGMVKAPIFAVIIGVVGCHAGMQVKSNAESLGQQTSKSVVTAIFAVIVADALFSIFFAEIGV
jgi:phospholipid/cholesterol/gamma-HCH transport system permease protein